MVMSIPSFSPGKALRMLSSPLHLYALFEPTAVLLLGKAFGFTLKQGNHTATLG